MDQLRRLGHQPDGDAGAAADEGGQHDQPDLVGANQCTQRLRRMQYCVAERAARTVLASGRTSPCLRGRRGARDG